MSLESGKLQKLCHLQFFNFHPETNNGQCDTMITKQNVTKIYNVPNFHVFCRYVGTIS